MSDVKRYWTDRIWTQRDGDDDELEVVEALHYDALAQRCRELEEDASEQAALLEEARGQRDFLDKLQSDECARRVKAEAERDTLRAEVERLRDFLKRVGDLVNTLPPGTHCATTIGFAIDKEVASCARTTGSTPAA